MDVIPLKYGTMFKRVFSDIEVFKQFVKDVLDITLDIDKVHTEYEYPKPIGFVRSRYDLFAEDKEQRIIVEIQQVKEGDFFDRFLYYHLISMVEQVGGWKEYAFDRTVYTIVVLTSTPQDGSIDFSCAISDMNPVNEQGKTIDVYPHRLFFLCPRQVNEKTPKHIKKWLDFIEDSLDGKIDEDQYQDDLLQKIINTIKERTIDPDLLSEIKDDMAWEEEKKRFRKESREEGLKEGREKGREEERLKQQQQVILKARKMGLSDEDIADLVGLSLIEIQHLI
jgi:predicted transposase/invertase (TIGR01784 family)